MHLLTKQLFRTAGCALLALSLAPSSSARIFTVTDGQTLDADLISIDRNQVTFRLTEDGKDFLLPLNQLSPKDRSYILAQEKAGLLSSIPGHANNLTEVTPVTKRPEHFDASKNIDKFLAKYRQAQGVKPAPIIDDATYLRRAYLKIIGRIPTYAEATHFFSNTNPKKRSQLVDRLLDSQGYVSHSFNFWADILRIQTEGYSGTNKGGMFYIPWLKDQIRRNVPYDKFVQTLLTADGDAGAYVWDNPAISYYLRDFGNPLTQVELTTQIFLGTQMQCAQCHNHPTEELTQKGFYELASYSHVLKSVRFDYADKFPELKEADLRLKEMDEAAKKQNKHTLYAKTLSRMCAPLRNSFFYKKRELKLPHDYQYDDAKPKEGVEPKVLFGEQPNASLEDPRKLLKSYADWFTSKDNERFALVMANRMWQRVMGKGLIEPIDNFTKDTVVDDPKLMEYLESLMITLDYDLKQYLRVLYNTEHFQRKSVIDNPDLPDDYHLEGPVFKRMSAEQFWDSLMTLITPDIDQTLTPVYYSGQNGIKWNTNGLRPAMAFYLNEDWSVEQIVTMIAKLHDLKEEAHPFIRRIKLAKTSGNLEEIPAIQKEMKKVEEAIFALQNPGLAGPDANNPDLSMAKVNFSSVESTGRALSNKQLLGFRRASELQSPARLGHLLGIFGQGSREEVEDSLDGGNLLQALFLMNSEQINLLMAERSAPVMEAQQAKTLEGKIETFYLGFLSRKPSEQEISALLPSFKKDPEKARKRIIWAMLNTREFIFIK